MRKGLTLVEILVVILVIGVLAVLLLPAVGRTTCGGGKAIACINNLAQLWKMQHNYMVTYGGTARSMPSETGGLFWLKLTTVTPPLIDATLKDIFACPAKGMPPAAGQTDYRGPASDVNGYADDDPVGADKIGNHGPGEGGNVLRKSGDVLCASENDPLWILAGSRTNP